LTPLPVYIVRLQRPPLDLQRPGEAMQRPGEPRCPVALAAPLLYVCIWVCTDLFNLVLVRKSSVCAAPRFFS
jgi:hypothetical protein